MRESSSDFRDTLLELKETAPAPVEHPSPDLWLAYQRSELPAGEEARLQEHLACCRDCFDLAEAAAAFSQPDEEPPVGEEVETAALWRLLRPQLDPPPGNVREISAGPRRRSWTWTLPSTLAASFFVALVVLTVWNLRQRSALEALREPRPNAPIAVLSTGERLSTPASAETILPSSTGMLELHPAEELPAYRLTLRDAATGGELWSYELRPDEDSALTLQLPAGLQPDRYRLELSDRAGGRVLETYLVRVTEPERGD